MTMTPEEKLAMAESLIPACAIELHGQRLHPEAEVKRAILLAIDRMQERVRAETERCARIAEGHVNRPLHLLPKTIAAAIRETPHAEG